MRKSGTFLSTTAAFGKNNKHTMLLRRVTPSRRWLAILCTLLFVAIAGVNAQAERFNIGSNADWTDGTGRLWKKDPYTIGRQHRVDCTSVPILNTADEEIYCSNRYFTLQTTNYQPFIVTVPVSQTGQHRVRLHFAETVS